MFTFLTLLGLMFLQPAINIGAIQGSSPVIQSSSVQLQASNTLQQGVGAATGNLYLPSTVVNSDTISIAAPQYTGTIVVK